MFIAIPTTSCEAERVFSDMKRVKSVVRSTLSQGKLNSFMLLHLHADIPVDTRLVVNTVLSVKE